MTNEFLNKEELGLIFNTCITEFKKQQAIYKPEFLSIDTSSFTGEFDQMRHIMNLLRNLCFLPDNDVSEHFENLGYKSKAHHIFLNTIEVHEELRSIANRNIVKLDYVNVLNQIHSYQDFKICCILFAWSDTHIAYSDRKKSSLKHETDNELRKIVQRTIPEINMNYLQFLNQQNPHGFTRDDLVNNMHDGKFDSFFFKQEFHNYFEPGDPCTSEKNTLNELYNLFRIVTKNSKFIPESEYNAACGYDNLENYKYVHVKRLLFER